MGRRHHRGVAPQARRYRQASWPRSPRRAGALAAGATQAHRRRPVASTQDQLPGVPLYSLDSDDDSPDSANGWSLLELKPAQADDYPHRDDLLVAVTANVQLCAAFTRTIFSIPNDSHAKARPSAISKSTAPMGSTRMVGSPIAGTSKTRLTTC